MACCKPAAPRDPASDCTLDDPARDARLARIEREILPHVTSASRLPDGFAWELEASARVKLERWVALERECCGHVSWEIVPRADGSRRLEVRGDDPAVERVASLASARPSRTGR